MMIDFKFHSIADIRKDNSPSAILIGVLAKLYPDTFGEFYWVLSLNLPVSDAFMARSGMLVQYIEGKIVSIAVVADGTKIDRVFTLPNYRRQGHAKRMLLIIKDIADERNITLNSPVDMSVVSMFEKAGWVKKRGNNRNKDGTIEFVSNESISVR